MTESDEIAQYGQYCPISRASEILAERWTPLIVRNLMFGADTPLVMDALQMAAIAAAAGAAGVFFLLRRRKADSSGPEPRAKTNLEERVEVLERIATDRSIDLADEIEALRETPATERRLEAEAR